MAQMTEKRTTSSRSGTAAKENHSLTGRQNQQNHHNQGHQRSGKGIEILDFHESWLEEVELYKDKMVMCKKLAHHNHVPASSHHLQPHLAAPNRNHGRIVQSSTPQHRSSAGGGSAAGATASDSVSARYSPPGQKQRSPPSPRKRLTPEKVANLGGGGGGSKVGAQRIIIRGTPPNSSTPKVAATPSNVPVVANSVLQSEPYKKVQVSATPDYLFVSL